MSRSALCRLWILLSATAWAAPALALPTIPVADAQVRLTSAPALPLPADGAFDSPAYLLFKTLLVLGVVVAIIYLTLHVGGRKLLSLQGRHSGLVRVIERQVLEPKRSLCVVEAAGEYFLVGLSESGFSSVGKLDPAVVQRHLSAPKPPRGFLALLDSKRAATSAPVGDAQVSATPSVLGKTA